VVAFFRFVLVCYSIALLAAICLAIFEPPDMVTGGESDGGIANAAWWGGILLLLAHALLSSP
jgi:hypothetical protein